MVRREEEIKDAIAVQKSLRRHLEKEKGTDPRNLKAVDERLVQLLEELKEVKGADAEKIVQTPEPVTERNIQIQDKINSMKAERAAGQNIGAKLRHMEERAAEKIAKSEEEEAEAIGEEAEAGKEKVEAGEEAKAKKKDSSKPPEQSSVQDEYYKSKTAAAKAEEEYYKKEGKKKIKEGKSESEGSFIALLLMFITLGLAVLDYFWFHFGGFDYNDILTSFETGGFTLVIKVLVPIYALAFILVVELIFVAKEHKAGWYLILLLLSLLGVNAITSKFGEVILPFIGVSLTGFVIAAVVIFSSFKFMDQDVRREFYSFVCLVIVVSTILSFGGIVNVGLPHLAIAAFVWLFVRSETEDTAKANYWIAGLLFMDFFGFGIIKGFIPLTNESSIIANRFVFPIWFLFVSVYSLEYKKSKLIKAIVIGVFIFYILAVVDGVYGWTDLKAQMRAHPEEYTEARSFWADAVNKIFKVWPRKIVAEYDRGMEYATGGYYKGMVEENEDEELGVYPEGIEAADKKFFSNEQVVVWGDLKARTLDEPIKVTMSCGSGDVTGTIIPASLANKEGYEIQKLEEVGFECRLPANKLKNGTNEVKIKAEFNFKTLAFLKTYFMDIERIRALRRENLDPLGEYGITDRIPTAVYTNGPVKLGMGTIDPPLGVRDNDVVPSFIGVTVEPQWVGEIKNITKIEIDVPSVLELTDLCRGGFERVGEEGGYTKYKMTDNAIKQIKTPITVFKSWRCSLTVPKANEVLGNTPVTTYYYRAKVEYIFKVEKSISVYVQPQPGLVKINLTSCIEPCTNSGSCICDADECKIPRGGEVGVGYSCNDTASS